MTFDLDIWPTGLPWVSLDGQGYHASKFKVTRLKWTQHMIR